MASKENKIEKENTKKESKTESKKEETRKKIEEVLKAKAEGLEKAAEEIAPEFDYEKEAEELAFEERGEEILERKGPLPQAEVSTSKYPKERKTYKSWFGRTFLQDRNAWVFSVVLVLLAMTISWGYAYWIPQGHRDTASAALSQGSHAQDGLVTVKVEEKTEKIKSQSIVMLDPGLASGVQVVEEGNDGKAVYTYTKRYINGEKYSTEKKLKKWLVKPHDNKLRLGTSATGHKGKYKVVRTFTANCTAYTSRPGAGGALGLGVHYGTCAVDPSYVSYRSEMWIEGYGYAFANDCGGAVRGNIVDLWMGSTSACINWGRRNCTAYVLVPAN